MDRLEVVLNASRVSVTGGGLARFAIDACRALRDNECLGEVIAQRDFLERMGVGGTCIPQLLSIRSEGSALRPILWWMYSATCLVRHGKQVVSTTHHALPFSRRQIVVVHDLRPLRLADSVIQRLYFRYWLPAILRRVDAVVTVSENTRSQLIRGYGIEPSRIWIVPNSVDRTSWERPDGAGSVGEPYLLMVGASWPHKNAHELLGHSDLWADRFALKIVAAEGGYRNRLVSMVNRLGLTSRVECVGGLGDSQLRHLMWGASGLVYPSIDEGFGIPPLEALAAGITPIVSDIPVFREVLGDAAIFVRLGERQSWKEAFQQLVEPGTAGRILDARESILARYTYAEVRAAWHRALRGTWSVPEADAEGQTIARHFPAPSEQGERCASSF